MTKDKRSALTTQQSADGIAIAVPRQFTPDAVIHAVILTVGIILLGAVLQSRFHLPSLIPPAISTHPALLMWSVLFGAYAVFFLLCITGVGSQSLWRLGELGRRGSYAALMMYSVQAQVTVEYTTITQTWFIRKSTRKFKISEITGIEADECGLTVSTSSGRQETIWFSLYPPTVKKLRRELQQAIGTVAKRGT